MKNQVQLITYVDRLGGGGLRDLHALLATGGALHGLFGGVHCVAMCGGVVSVLCSGG